MGRRLVLLVLTLALVGCGDGTDRQSVTSKPPEASEASTDRGRAKEETDSFQNLPK